MGKDGKYGNLQIGVSQLVENKTLVKTGNFVVIDKNIDSYLINLLTKEYTQKGIITLIPRQLREINLSFLFTIKTRKCVCKTPCP